MSEHYRIRLDFDGFENVFMSLETYSRDRAYSVAQRLADRLGPDSFVEVECVITDAVKASQSSGKERL